MATRGAAVEAEAARGAAIGAAQGRNPGGTVGAGRGATSGSNPGGISEAGWQGAMVLAVVCRVPTVETVEPDSQKKSRSVGLGEAAKGKLSSSKFTC
jgi:L-aminopeptidase/D-esterase-like protein